MITSADRIELDGIRRDQNRVHELVSGLDARIDVLSRRLEAPTAEPVPPRPRESERPVSWYEEPPPPLPSLRPGVPAAAHESAAPAASKPPPPPASASAEPLELRLGTYWMSRIGIVILLTGLVFLGNYAYHRIVPLLGPWGKIALLTLAGAALGGLGVWLERSREATRNFGRVLLAGGAATLYYTAYAAHFVDRLRVIESPLLGGGLLLALTGMFVFAADRRRSEAIAVPGVLLAYYTSALNPIGTFTLFSNLVLTGVAVLFLVRRRWTRLTALSLAATYGSYAFWRFGHGLAGDAGLGTAMVFLALYWALFTAAAFLADSTATDGATRVAFLTLNNGAFFAFATMLFRAQMPGSFWIFALAFGATLLGLAALAARVRSEERALDGAYLAQGLAMVTLGLAAKLTGPQLALVLAVESTVLLTALRRRHGWLYEVAAALCAFAGWGLALDAIHHGRALPLALGGPVAALLIFDAWWVKHLRGEGTNLCLRAFGFAVLGLGMVAAILWKIVPAPWQPLAFALVAVASLAAARVRLAEIVWPGQAMLAGGLLIFVSRFGEIGREAWWWPAPFVVVAVALLHWWERQKTVAVEPEIRVLLQPLHAAIAVVAGAVWMRALHHGDAWLVATSAGAMATLLYGGFARSWALAAAGQLFTLLSVSAFAAALAGGEAGRWAALVPVVNVTAAAALARFLPTAWRSAETETIAVREIAIIYRILAAALLAAWAFVHISVEWRVAFYAACGVAQIAAGAATASRERRIIGAVYAAAALAFFWARFDLRVAWVDLLAIVAIPASLRVARRLCGEVPVLPAGRDALVGAAVASVWWWVTRWMVQFGHGSQLTAAWALLALLIFAAGLALRERIYRLGGFGVLALAVGRLFIFDVWRFDTLPRIVSFLALGVVLLVLSFVYHRFAEAIRRWL